MGVDGVFKTVSGDFNAYQPRKSVENVNKNYSWTA